MEDQRSPEYAAAYDQAIKKEQEEKTQRTMDAMTAFLERATKSDILDTRYTGASTITFGPPSTVGLVMDAMKKMDGDVKVDPSEYSPDRRPVNARQSKPVLTDVVTVIKTVANGLVFTSLPPADHPNYQGELLSFIDALNVGAKSINPNIDRISVIKHEKTKETERGACEGELFLLKVESHDEESPDAGSIARVMNVRLTHTTEQLMKQWRDTIKKATAQQKLTDGFSSYFRCKQGLSEGTSMDKIYETMVEHIDTAYEIGVKNPFYTMESLPFYEEHIDLLIKKIKTLELDENVNNEVLKNNAILLKYFLCKYLKLFYTEKYNNVK